VWHAKGAAILEKIICARASKSAVRSDDVPISMARTSGDDVFPKRRWFTLDIYPTIFR
jgi:hypothetical protein